MHERIGRWRGRASQAIKSFQFSRFTKSRSFLAVSVVLTLVVGVFFIWAYPRQASSELQGLTDLERLQAENDARATNAQIFLGISLLIGVWLTHRRVRAVEKQAESAARQADTAEQGQITERFTRAIEQLGKAGDENLAIRLGGIYSLERIMRDSHRDFATVREVLSASVREGTRSDDDSDYEPSADIYAALTVLGRNLPPDGTPTRPIDLGRASIPYASLYRANFSDADLFAVNFTESDLEEAVFTNANLLYANLTGATCERADFSRSNLAHAILQKADLHQANFSRATLASASLTKASLREAKLRNSDLRNAILRGVDLREADLFGANILGADLRGANLEQVRGLHSDQLAEAKVDEHTRMP